MWGCLILFESVCDNWKHWHTLQFGIFTPWGQLANSSSSCVVTCMCVFVFKILHPNSSNSRRLCSRLGDCSLFMLPAGPGKRLSSLSPFSNLCFLPCLISEPHALKETHVPKGLRLPCLIPFRQCLWSLTLPKIHCTHNLPPLSPVSVKFLPCYLSFLVCLEHPQLWR